MNKRVKNFNSLIANAANYLDSKLYYAPSTLGRHTTNWYVIKIFMTTNGIKHYDQEVEKKLLTHKFKNRDIRKLSREEKAFYNSVKMLSEFHETGKINIYPRMDRRKFVFSGPIGGVITNFLKYVARFLSQQKFSSGAKAGYLLLTMKNEIVANFFATQNKRNKAYKEVAGLVSRFGAVNVVAYTNKADLNFYQELKADLHNLEINLHDVIECESSAFVMQTFDKYKSLASEGLLQEQQTNYITNKLKIMETENTLSEETLTNQGPKLNTNEKAYVQKNLDYINNQIKYLGFGEGFNDALKEAMKSASDKIDFPISREFFTPGESEKSKPVDFTLHFNKGKESNMYFLNSYSAQLKTGDPKMNQEQNFYLNKGKGFTAKEAFNLLSDRAVNKDLTNKEGIAYNAWVKLKPGEKDGEKGNRDFQIFNENYGFDLKETLSKYPIKEMETPEAADKLMSSLKKGNIQGVTFVRNGKESPKFISANPQFKNLNVYNHDGSVMFHNDIAFNKSQDAGKQKTEAHVDISPDRKESKSAKMKR